MTLPSRQRNRSAGGPHAQRRGRDSRSAGGAQAAAALLSLIGSCRLHGIDPWGYLNTVLGVINDHPANRVAEVTPLRLARTSAAAQLGDRRENT